MKNEESKLKTLTNEELCVIYRQGDTDILEVLLKKNKNLIWSRVKLYVGYLRNKLDEDDLFQSGSMGLIEAIKKFEHNKGANLATYAVYWIDQKIRRDIIEYGLTIRIPVHMIELIHKINNISFKNIGASKEEIFKLMEKEKVSWERFNLAIKLRLSLMDINSLNVIVGEHEGIELINLIRDDSESVEKNMKKKF